MNHWEMENTIHVGVALKEADFQVSQVCCSRQSCFDFAARKSDEAVLVKVISDVDTFSSHSARELKVISDRFYAASLLISQQTHGKPLEDDTVYSRNGVFVVTEKTIRNIAIRTTNPLIYAGPGGYSVKVDGELVERRRKELGLSIGNLAIMIGVSRRTLYGYERGMAKASVKSAYKLAETLGVPVAKPINILERKRKHHQCLLMKARDAIIRKVLLQKVLKKLAFCDISPVYRAPFDFVMNYTGDKRVIVGSIVTRKEKSLNKRLEEIVSVCKVLRAYPVLITEKSNFSGDKVFSISMDDLSAMQTPEDMLAIL